MEVTMEAILDKWSVFKFGYHWVGEEEEAAEQVEFLRRLLYLPVGSKVLMPFCGPGWYAHELSMWGFQVVGTEFVSDFLQEAKQRGLRLGLSATFLFAELMALPFRNEQFNGAMIVGNRFGMTGDEKTDLKFLRELSRVMKRKARLVMALPHRDGLLQGFQERDWETMMDGKRILVFRKWDAMAGQMWEEWREINSEGDLRLFLVIYRVYTLTELERLLQSCDFRLTNAFGNFMGGELNQKSRWMVIQALKD
ncbi:MAG: class I SAM-dependent methyltransferase [Armatimonadetes bacterium]|nr:class I SAM-dependent methyltransferase [Armatimonadota bacterium]MDW8029077.1 class I SAM-dependent methyltransferase [Armatimonadota bacterium]